MPRVTLPDVPEPVMPWVPVTPVMVPPAVFPDTPTGEGVRPGITSHTPLGIPAWLNVVLQIELSDAVPITTHSFSISSHVTVGWYRNLPGKLLKASHTSALHVAFHRLSSTALTTTRLDC